MTDFSHFNSLEVSPDKVIDYPIHQIVVGDLSPILKVAPATEANKPLFNNLLKRAGKSGRALRAGNISAGMIDEGRDDDRELYPKYVIKGWENVFDAQGKEVTYTEDDCRAFVAALPNWMFDDLRTFAANPANFTEVVEMAATSGN